MYASAAMMVSLGHPQTHVGERGEPSKFQKKFVQDSCTVYMILVHKPLTAGWRGVNGRWDYEETRVAWCGHVDSVLSRHDILRLPSVQLSALYAARLIRYEVPVQDDDRVAVPPLTGFVMNRVGNDHMERLLYEIFVSSDETTTIAQCAPPPAPG